MLKFIVPGEPCAQGRPRFTTIGGYARAYDPAKSKNYKNFVKLLALQEMDKQGWLYTELPLKVTIAAYLECPKSKSKRFREAALSGKESPCKKPDVDNLFKTITDALSGVVYKDDKQICLGIIGKYYAEEPKVEVRIELLDNLGVHKSVIGLDSVE